MRELGRRETGQLVARAGGKASGPRARDSAAAGQAGLVGHTGRRLDLGGRAAGLAGGEKRPAGLGLLGCGLGCWAATWASVGPEKA